MHNIAQLCASGATRPTFCPVVETCYQPFQVHALGQLAGTHNLLTLVCTVRYARSLLSPLYYEDFRRLCGCVPCIRE